MATNPTTAPIQAPRADTFLPRTASKNIQAIIAAAEPTMVVAKALTAVVLAPSDEPALKPNQPNQSIPVPKITKGMLAGSWCLLSPNEVLRPNSIAPASAA